MRSAVSREVFVRTKLLAALVGLTICASGEAASPTEAPDLSIRFINAIPDVCFQTARGRPPSKENADALLLEPAEDVPPTVKAHFYRVATWFRLKSAPNNIFVGVGDRNNCHLVLANSTRTREVQDKVVTILKVGGFQTLAASAPSTPLNDMLFAKEAPDGYMLISLQAPRDTVRGGDGEQGAVHVSLIPRALFQSMPANK